MGRSTSRRRLIAEASDLIEEWTGFALRQTAPHRIAETFGRRAASLGYDDPVAYLQELRDLPRTADEPQRLVNLVTNGLTAFWRDSPQLSALRSLLVHLDPGPRALEPIHVWCAGVSTGEEAYTVAMIADEESVPVKVMGTDVNTDFISTARRGIYSDWSLRRLDDTRRDAYLSRIDNRHWRVDHDCFNAVDFRCHNILDPPPRSTHPDGAFDIVLCRNVLIYFSGDATTAALNNLVEALSDQGYLMFGSSEQIHPERLGDKAPALRPIRQGGGFLYRPGIDQTGQTIEPGRLSVDDEPDPPELPDISANTGTGVGLEETTSDVSETDTVARLLGSAAEHLEAGDHELGLACLEAALGYDPFHVQCHCVMGAVLHSLGALDQAVDAFQKALFLEPNHWFAAHRTAAIRETQGDADAARRMHRRARQGLNHPEDPVEETRLLNIVVGSLRRARQLAESSADEFFHLHG